MRRRLPHHIAYLLLGGNQGDRPALLAQTREQIAKRVGLLRAQSALYETEPWGFESIWCFVNQAVCVQTPLEPLELLDVCADIQLSTGRIRTPETDSGYSSRLMDIDIIFYDDQIIDLPTLVVPHPRMHLRRFVLRPLADIASNYRHPQLDATVAELLDRCEDSCGVWPMPDF